MIQCEVWFCPLPATPSGLCNPHRYWEMNNGGGVAEDFVPRILVLALAKKAPPLSDASPEDLDRLRAHIHAVESGEQVMPSPRKPRRVCNLCDKDAHRADATYCADHAILAKRAGEPAIDTRICPITDCDAVTAARTNTEMCAKHGQLARQYGLDNASLVGLLADGKCEVCFGTAKLSIDHDHSCCPLAQSCGKCVRGLICHGCNMALGFTGDDPSKLRALADYLERPRVDTGAFASTDP